MRSPHLLPYPPHPRPVLHEQPGMEEAVQGRPGSVRQEEQGRYASDRVHLPERLCTYFGTCPVSARFVEFAKTGLSSYFRAKR